MAISTKRKVLPEVDTKAARVLLVLAVFLLSLLGIIMVFSTTSATLASQGLDPFKDMLVQSLYVGVGLGVMLALWFGVPSHVWLGPLLWAFYGVCMAALVLTFFIGTSVNGAQRWLSIGPATFQPSEFVKIALLLMAIRIIYDKNTGKIHVKAAIVQFLGLVMFPLVFLFFTQSDLGTGAICVIGIFAVMWMGGINWKILVAALGIGFAALLFAIFGVGYRSNRLVYLNPWNDGQGGLGAGYNIIHAYYAIASGGLFGQGIGGSHEKYDYLFAADSDFIFAVVCEELGLVGAICVIGLFIVILYAGLKIAKETDDPVGRMIAGGFVVMLVFQAFLNIGCTIGVFPTTGKPLPFISSGGSSVISSMMIIGLLLSVARSTEESQDYGRKRDNLRVVRTGRG